jgi:oligopeptide transport system permease protein
MNPENTIRKNDGLDDLFVHVDIKEEESEKIASEPYSYWKSVFRIFIHRPATILALCVLAVLILGIIFIPLFAPEDAYVINMDNKNFAPSVAHFFGTDLIGRDLWFITWKGAGKSLLLAIIESVIILFVGTIAGLCWGYFKKLDPIFVEIYNFVSNIPSLLIYMLLSVVFTYSLPDVPVEVRLVLSLTMLGWLSLALMIRNLVLIIDNREYNVASKTLATPPLRVMLKNYLPYLLGVIITEFSLIIPGMISSEVSLSYFGVGLATRDISLGAILEIGIANYSLYPWEILAPGLLLAIIIFAFFILGTTFSDALDPKKHR